MGLRTKHWGPHAWRVLRSLANYWDHHGVHAPIKWWGLLDSLPCSHCRTCSQAFWSSYPHRITARYNRDFIYLLHQHVNVKLMRQEAHAAASDKELQEVLNHWYRVQPPVDQHYVTKIGSLTNLLSVTSYLCFSVYDRHAHTREATLVDICTMLPIPLRLPLGFSALTRADKVGFICRYMTGVVRACGHSGAYASESFLDMCVSAVVSCDA